MPTRDRRVRSPESRAREYEQRRQARAAARLAPVPSVIRAVEPVRTLEAADGACSSAAYREILALLQRAVTCLEHVVYNTAPHDGRTMTQYLNEVLSTADADMEGDMDADHSP